MSISKKIRLATLISIGALIAAAVLLRHATPTLLENKKILWLKDIPINIAIAKTNSQRQRGLGGRDSLPPNHGMFFVFDHDDRYNFWMKDMHFAIDILWLDQNLTVVDIKLNAAPESYPTNFTPRSPSRFVLELPAGFSRKHGVTIGNRLHF